MTKRQSLTRTCSACGIEKPISAFMQLGGKNGTTYGTICASCRGRGILEQSNKTHLEDERSSTSSGFRLGAKEHFDREKQQKLEHQHRIELTEKEVKKRELLNNEKTEHLEKKEQLARAHRETYIETKNKQGFLSNYQNRQLSSLLGVRKDETGFINIPVSNETQLTAAELIKTEATKEQQRITQLDLSGAPIIDQANFMINRENPTFYQFEKWLGETPLTKTRARLYKAPPANPNNKSALEKNAVEKVLDYVNKTWDSPGKKK